MIGRPSGMPTPPLAAATGGGEAKHPTPSHIPANNQHTLQPNSYAAALYGTHHSVPRLKTVALAHRPISFIDNIPAVLFTDIEEDQLCRQRENTLIMKFSSGKPRLEEIRAHIASTWNLDAPPAVGYLDPLHVTINMASPADTRMALARPSNKINNSMFRLFRWTPDFEIGKESSIVAVWVKFYGLPLH